MNPITTAPPVIDLKATDTMILVGLLGIMLFILSLAYGAVYVRENIAQQSTASTAIVSKL